MVEGACLENRCTATYRGFESLTHRSKPAERWLFASRSGFHPFYPRRFAAAPRGMPIPLRFIGCLHCFDASHLADVPARRRCAFALLKVPSGSAATKSLTHRSGTAPTRLRIAQSAQWERSDEIPHSPFRHGVDAPSHCSKCPVGDRLKRCFLRLAISL